MSTAGTGSLGGGTPGGTASAQALATQLQNQFTTTLNEIKAGLQLTPPEQNMITLATTTIATNTLALIGASGQTATTLAQEIAAAKAILMNVAVAHQIQAANTLAQGIQNVIQTVISIAIQAAIKALL